MKRNLVLFLVLLIVSSIRAPAQVAAIKAGRAADIIATPENPLEDIRALKKASFVMKDGKVFKK